MSNQTIHQIGTVTKVLFARLRFLAVFLVAALVVGYWDNIKNHWDKWTRPSAAAVAEESRVEYVCPMHPQVRREKPGTCPYCGMPLEQREKGKPTTLPADVLARVQLSPQRIALAGIQTSPVEPRTLVHEIHAVGVLDYDETKVAQLSARVAGRADTLFIRSNGQEVKQGDPVYSLYSPELYAAQREYLLARKRVNELPKDASPETRSDASAVYNATMEKLVLWGINRQQLDNMDKEFDASGKVPSHLTVVSPIAGRVIRKDIFEGGYVQAGDRPYTIADLSTLWLQAKIYERDVPLVHTGAAVDVVVEAIPNQVLHGVVTFLAIQVDPQTRTVDARIEVPNKKTADGDLLRPGMFADAAIRVPVSPADVPATQPATRPSSAAALLAAAFKDALSPYLQAQQLLAADKADGVTALLQQSVKTLDAVKDDPQIHSAYMRYAEAVSLASDKDLEALRKAFKPISVALIDIGKLAGLTTDAADVRIFRCPMPEAGKPYWLQIAGETRNPYWGSQMLTCGGPVESLPKFDPNSTPTTRPVPASGKVLAIPRSAVIDTGRQKIVYVESSPGVFDMCAVKVGALAGDYYPVFGGLTEGDRVVTVGNFLVDAENRLNPAPAR